jgi:hypothetical protein
LALVDEADHPNSQYALGPHGYLVNSFIASEDTEGATSSLRPYSAYKSRLLVALPYSTETSPFCVTKTTTTKNLTREVRKKKRMRLRRCRKIPSTIRCPSAASRTRNW